MTENTKDKNTNNDLHRKLMIEQHEFRGANSVCTINKYYIDHGHASRTKQVFEFI